MMNKTYNNEALSIDERIFCSLTDTEGLEVKRTAKLLSLVIAHMIGRGKLTVEEVDELLRKIEDPSL